MDNEGVISELPSDSGRVVRGENLRFSMYVSMSAVRRG